MANKILIVEDNPVQMKLTCTMLEKIENVTLFQASDGIQARDCLKTNKIEIVLCDIGLPGESGLDLTQYMVSTYKDIVVIILTADEDLGTSEKAIGFGAFQYLVKPVKPSQLRISIQAALRIKQFQHVIKAQRSVLEAEIEQLKKTKADLEKSQDEFNTLFENIQEGFYRLDEDGRLIMANQVLLNMLGYKDFDEVRGIEVITLYNNPDDRAKLIKAILKNGKISTYEVNLKHKNGRIVTVLVNACVRKDKNNNAIGMEGTIADITERKHLESELLQAQKLESIGQLAAGIAHEINTPIQYVGDNTQFMKDAFTDLIRVIEPIEDLLAEARKGKVSKEQIQALEDAIEDADIEYLMEEVPASISQSLEGVNNVSRIVKSMKAFSHPGGDEKEMADINLAIQNTVTVTKNEWKYLADIQLDLDENLPMILCYPGEINQVILNMIINASHAISETLPDRNETKGKITIQTRASDDHIEIVITDDGPGIPEKIKNKIFDPFFTTKEVGKGTGQGLAISRSVVVDKHGGEISLETAPGKGTSFRIKLPKE